jgi:hypothetical protein
MKACWIGILGTGALVISAFGQNSVALRPSGLNSVLVSVSPDRSRIATARDVDLGFQPDSGCFLRVREPHAPGLMPSQLLGTGHLMLDDQLQEETPVSGVRVSGDTLVVSPPAASPDVPTAMVKHLGLTPIQIATIQAQIAEQRGQVQSLMEQFTNNRCDSSRPPRKGGSIFVGCANSQRSRLVSWSHWWSRTAACRPKPTRSSRPSNGESLMK